MIQHIKTISLAALVAGVSLTKVYAEGIHCTSGTSADYAMVRSD
ncbi:hypothetical protein [Tritonibacter sp. SIMBA_163]|uniref:Uncharacterized protein n=1 Tax=Tritonibacter scottomollicae TaxID=483013 RepID=A0A2T1AGC0_TRISK|nr:hypothetical protein CLV89_106144 [Tritonibacter scottomollicae]